MAEDRKEGLAAAVELLMAETGQTQGRAKALRALAGEQLALMPTPAVIEDAGADDDGARRAGPGRPAGSRNRSTNEWVEFIATRYRSPLLFLAEAYSRPAAQLAHELGCDRDKALALQLRAAETLALYMHQKQPVSVAISAEGEITLQLVAPQPAPTPLAGPPPLLTIEHETEEKQ